MNILDTRDLQERLEELESELDDLQTTVAEAQEELNECEDEDEQEALADTLNEATTALEDWQADNQEEFDALNQLKDEIGSEWSYGVTLIDEDDFTEYAEDLASDLYGEQVRNASWPFCHIDWEAAADSLRMDYSQVDYLGTTYLYRG